MAFMGSALGARMSWVHSKKHLLEISNKLIRCKKKSKEKNAKIMSLFPGVT